jgi:CO/xanthine dehydrogenase FAD-binding subunit
LRNLPNLARTLDVLAREPGVWRPFAGGTDLMVLLEAGKLAHRRYLNICKLSELAGIEVTQNEVRVGALATYSDIQRHPLLSRSFSLLCQAASETGSVATQNRGTLGGNIANASPAADSPPALLAYDASLELVSNGGTRIVRYSQFHSGYKVMDLRPDELIQRICLPRLEGQWTGCYRKVGTRRAQAISKVCFAGLALMDGGRIAEVRLALGSVAPMAIRAAEIEKVLRGERPSAALIALARETLKREIAPIDDFRSTAQYRSQVAANLLGAFLETLGHQKK